ncbi:sensor histidine kinase [Micromonospora globbae]|uniref:histidine kinase n=1 Tax=Micromonospora globbae TaxID=1894969 RepID=A0A420F003_9ACTN|nr:histidine kinase [Micromonospora globbae]RKF26302.1 sensor histidine kinase [Micromonospora globbae]
MDRLAAWWAARTRGGVRAVLAVDGSLALVLGALAALGAWDAAGDRGMRLGVAGVALVGVAAAGLVVRRVWPLAALGLSLAATLAYLALGYPYSPILQLASVAAYTVGAWCPKRVSLTAVAAAVAVYLPVAWSSGGTPWPAFGVGPLAVVWLVVPWSVGTAVRAYRRVRARAADAERREHVYQERLRIAQEVHDVVGHSLAVINMQAGVALHVLERRPQRAAQALRAVRQTSAQALEELRAALAPLAEPDGRSRAEPDRRPVADLARVPELVEAVNQGRLRVTLVVEGHRRVLPAAVELAGYRIVQESLTNVVRHAEADRATVRLAYGDDALRVTVSDDGRGPATGDGAGRGLVGMRERAAAVGGTFAAGAGADGGFEVRAVLPVTRAGGAPSTGG